MVFSCSLDDFEFGRWGSGGYLFLTDYGFCFGFGFGAGFDR